MLLKYKSQLIGKTGGVMQPIDMMTAGARELFFFHQSCQNKQHNLTFINGTHKHLCLI